MYTIQFCGDYGNSDSSFWIYFRQFFIKQIVSHEIVADLSAVLVDVLNYIPPLKISY